MLLVKLADQAINRVWHQVLEWLGLSLMFPHSLQSLLNYLAGVPDGNGSVAGACSKMQSHIKFLQLEQIKIKHYHLLVTKNSNRSLVLLSSHTCSENSDYMPLELFQLSKLCPS
ncbi:hypothetical protein P8452_14706 [Trifolium repens]|nr:hypothetical protein P8452_14706 [Trifolium repens]